MLVFVRLLVPVLVPALVDGRGWDTGDWRCGHRPVSQAILTVPPRCCNNCTLESSLLVGLMFNQECFNHISENGALVSLFGKSEIPE